MAAWVKGEVSCCSLISGRDCESPAEPVQPEEALLCRTQTRFARMTPSRWHKARHHSTPYSVQAFFEDHDLHSPAMLHAIETDRGRKMCQECSHESSCSDMVSMES